MQDQYTELQKRLRKFRERRKRIEFLQGLLLFLAVAAAVWAVLPAVYSIAPRDTVFRWLVSLSSASLLIYFGWRQVILPLYRWVFQRHVPPLDKVALEIGSRFPEIKDEFSNALQIVQEAESQSDSEKALAWAAFWQTAQKVAPIPFENSLSLTRLKQHALMLAASAAVLVVLLSFFPTAYQNTAMMWVRPWQVPPSKQLTLNVTPGHVEVLRGSSLTVTVEVPETRVRSIALTAMYQNGKVKETLPLFSRSPNRFEYRFENINEPFEYRINADELISETYRVTLIDPPDVRDLQLTVKPPRYTRLPEQKLEPNVGNVQVLAGSRIHLQVQTNKPVDFAAVVFAQRDTLFLEQDNSGYIGEFRASRDDSYFIHLKDDRGLTNPNPIEYRIKTIADQPPVVEIVFPGQDVDIDESMAVMLGVMGEDDYGFSRLLLKYTVHRGGPYPMQDSGQVKVPFRVENGQLRAEFDWDLTELDLLPEDVVEYRAVVYDNDAISGPKKAESSIFRLRFPSIQEIFAEAAQQQDEAEETFSEMLEKSREIQENLDHVLREIRRNKELSWEEKQALKEELKEQQEMLRELEEVKQKIDEMVDKLERNDLLALETLKKYQELQQLLEEIATPELKKMIEAMNRALENVDPRLVQKALEEMQFSQEEFLNSLERTINMLKQLQAEQKLEEALKLAEEMLRQQEQINQSLEQNPDSASLQQLAHQERQLQEELNHLNRTLEELQKSKQETPQLPLPEEPVREAQTLAQSEQLKKDIQRAREMMQQGQPQQAKNAGKRVSGQLQQMQQWLGRAQQMMQQNQRAELMRQLRRGARNVLQLSKREEALSQQTRRLNASSPKYRNIADQQQDLLSATRRVTQQLFELTRNNFFVPHELGRKLGESLQHMQNAIRQLEERRSSQASSEQRKAMQALNGAAAQLRQAMQSLNNAQGGMGMSQFMQQLKGISDKQQGINQQTQSMGQSGQLSLQQQAALSRLAAQQEALRKSLQQLQKEFGNRKEILGSLDQIAEDMKKVAEEMRQKSISRELIRRQQRILSRLLDAQKSVHQRELSRKRKAETGKTYIGLDPGQLPSNLGETEFKIHQDLLRALRENYARDYKELIQKYFEALTREKRKNGSNF